MRKDKVIDQNLNLYHFILFYFLLEELFRNDYEVADYVVSFHRHVHHNMAVCLW